MHMYTSHACILVCENFCVCECAWIQSSRILLRGLNLHSAHMHEYMPEYTFLLAPVTYSCHAHSHTLHCMHVCMHVWLSVCMYACLYACLYVYMYLRIHVCVYVRTYSCVRIYRLRICTWIQRSAPRPHNRAVRGAVGMAVVVCLLAGFVFLCVWNQTTTHTGMQAQLFKDMATARCVC